ncbi:MAG: hypothetical protein ABJF67_17635 [Aurantimonas coralicida]|uniref:hypothetical protein n=1 Tax=Nisaea sp. TaxID=2024842 RepID=UPI003265359D
MQEGLQESVYIEIERARQSGTALILGDAGDRVMRRIGESGQAMTDHVEQQLVREASRASIPVMFGRTNPSPR